MSTHPPPEIPQAKFTLGIDREIGGARPLYLNYIYVEVMYNQRGRVAYDWKTNHFIFYLSLDESDWRRQPSLDGITEVWIALNGRETGES